MRKNFVDPKLKNYTNGSFCSPITGWGKWTHNFNWYLPAVWCRYMRVQRVYPHILSHHWINPFLNPSTEHQGIFTDWIGLLKTRYEPTVHSLLLEPPHCWPWVANTNAAPLSVDVTELQHLFISSFWQLVRRLRSRPRANRVITSRTSEQHSWNLSGNACLRRLGGVLTAGPGGQLPPSDMLLMKLLIVTGDEQVPSFAQLSNMPQRETADTPSFSGSKWWNTVSLVGRRYLSGCFFCLFFLTRGEGRETVC